MNIFKFAPVTMFVGLPGCGKTTFASAIVYKCLKKKRRVLSNVPIKGALEYNFLDDFGLYEEFAECHCILDEAGIDANNRDWEHTFSDKNKGKDKLDYLKKIRHFKSNLIVLSQTWNDCDIKIRQMTGLLYILKKSIIPGFTVAVPVFRKIDVDEETHEFKELYYKDHPILRLFTSIHIFRPKYYKMFDSWERRTLPYKGLKFY